MQKLLKIILLLPLFSGIGCVDPYNPPAITSATKYLVVDGFINAGDGPTVFKLSYTRNIGDTTKGTINDAEVYVEGKGGGVFQLLNTGKGEYKIEHLNLNSQDQYRLRIILPGKKEYQSDFVEVKKTPDIDAIAWKKTEDGIMVLVSTHDPSGNSRYYSYEYDEAWKFHSAYYSGLMRSDSGIVYRPPVLQIYYCFQFNTSKNINTATSEFLTEDVISNYPLTSISVRNSNKLSVKYSILVKQMALTKQAFEYWNNLKKVTENVGSLFDPQPVTFSGNIHSTSDDKEIVLGFVSAADKKEKRIFITTEEVGFIKVYTGYEGCDLDTVPSKSKLTIEAGDEPVTETSGPGGGSLLLVGAYSCIDCRARGTIQKPGFWED